MNQVNFDVVWADGTHDSAKTCSECGSPTCKHPVHIDRYRVISTKKAKEWDAQAFNDEDIEAESQES